MFSDESHFELTYENRSSLSRRPSGWDRLDPLVHPEDHQAPAQADGLGLLQLEGEGCPGVVEEGGNDEWDEVSPNPG
jgi:hypothetical protein